MSETEADRESLRRECLRRAAMAYESAERWREAAECWEERGDVDQAQALYLLGEDPGGAAEALFATGRYAAALESYRAWEEALPASDVADRVRALLGQWACHLSSDASRRPGDEGRDAYRRARSLTREAPQVYAVTCWTALGEIGARVRRLDLVQEGYEEALALCEDRHAGPLHAETCRAYLEAVRDFGDRLLASELERKLAEVAEGK